MIICFIRIEYIFPCQWLRDRSIFYRLKILLFLPDLPKLVLRIFLKAFRIDGFSLREMIGDCRRFHDRYSPGLIHQHWNIQIFFRKSEQLEKEMLPIHLNNSLKEKSLEKFILLGCITIIIVTFSRIRYG